MVSFPFVPGDRCRYVAPSPGEPYSRCCVMLVSPLTSGTPVTSFYTTSDDYGFLCNFSAHGIAVDDHYWSTVEHYSPAQKFAGTEHEELDADSIGTRERLLAT